MENFLTQMAEILEVESVKPDESLNSFEYWDSLAILSVIALAYESYKVDLTADIVRKSKTVGDLRELIKSKNNLNNKSYD
jgi:acyl carrier protein